MSRRPHVRTVRPLAAWTAALLAIACATVAAACLWDRDTLAAEARGLPGVLEIVVGRFERHPDAYYVARLERAETDRAADPGDWRSWDDAVVALDRLGRHDEAVALASAQRAAMDAAGAGAGADDDARYRQLANHGTVLAHRWIVAGTVDERSDLLAARELIAAAIELNPDAHFGREAWQLQAIDWVIDGATIRADLDEATLEDREDEPPGDRMWIRHVPSLIDQEAAYGPEGGRDPIEGLVGMVVLGGGWESIDLLVALRACLRERQDHVAAMAVECRIDELVQAGRRPLHPATEVAMLRSWRSRPTLEKLRTSPERFALHGHLGASDVVRNSERIAAWFEAQRAKSRRWHAERAAWVETRLATHHPDHDEDFWAGAPPMPELDLPGWASRYLVPLLLFAAILLVLVGAFVVAIKLILRAVRRSRAAPHPG